MNKKLYPSFLALIITLSTLFFVNHRAQQRAAAAPAANYVLSSLPASDAVIFVDAQRLLTDSIPGVLGNSPKLLARVNECLDRFKEKTNIDLRTFDSVAIGVRFNDPAKSEDFKVVVLTEGRFDANAVLDAALTTAKREEGVHPQERQYDGRTLYVLSHRRQETKPEETTDKQETTDRHEMALAVFDANTFVFGDFESVRATLDISAERVSDELVQLATRTPGAVVGFSGNVPSFLTKQLASDNEPLARNFAAIRQVYGSITTTGSEAEAAITLRTENADQAREVSRAVSALKMLVSLDTKKPSLGDMRPIPELIKNLTVSNEGNEVFLNLKLSPADIASLARNF